MRLRDGTTLSGRVEICIDNLWGTVCDTSWSVNDAMVVCRQLGHSPESKQDCVMAAYSLAVNSTIPPIGAMALHSDQTPNGVGSIWLSNVQCTGRESRLIYCSTNPLGVHDCNHDGDVGVSCQPSTPGKFRTVGWGNRSWNQVDRDRVGGEVRTGKGCICITTFHGY